MPQLYVSLTIDADECKGQGVQAIDGNLAVATIANAIATVTKFLDRLLDVM